MDISYENECPISNTKAIRNEKMQTISKTFKKPSYFEETIGLVSEQEKPSREDDIISANQSLPILRNCSNTPYCNIKPERIHSRKST